MTQPTETANGGSRLPFIGPLQLLDGMSQQAVQDFNAMVRTTKRRRGEWIFVLGDSAETIYLLREGRVKMTALAEGGHEVLHEIIGPGGLCLKTLKLTWVLRQT